MTKYFTIFLLAVLSIYRNTAAESNQTKLEKCEVKHQKTFGILPGRGWDNLMNRMMGQIANYNFSKCHYSLDNRNLIPNDISLVPTNSFQAELKSEMFSHYKNYTSDTSYSVNVGLDIPFLGIGGSFSYEHQHIKQDQIATKFVFNRVHIRYKYLQSILEPDAELDPVFRNRILDIAAFVVDKKDTLFPEYLADLIVRDFGTHVIQTIDVGGVLSKTDFLKSDYVRKYEMDKTKMSASASASFGIFFSANVGYNKQVSQAELEEYNINSGLTRINAQGGQFRNSIFSLDQWLSSVENNLAPIDKSGTPIYEVITHRSLPELDDKTVYTINKLLKKAVKRYYDANTRIGCMNFDSPNFNPDANIDSGLCKPPEVNFTLGGVFQTCDGPDYQCASVRQVNFLTGTYNCPLGFMQLRLFSGLNRCDQRCTRSCILWIFCHDDCHTECSNYAIYWCYPKEEGPNNNGLMFGGFISTIMPQCAAGYVNVKIGLSSSMCVSTMKDNKIGIRFGGLYSCNIGNPLAVMPVSSKKSGMATLTYWPKHCAPGYVSHIASIERGCLISYCTETNKISLGAILPPKRPPFIELNYNPNTTKVTIFSVDGHKFVKSIDGVWDIHIIHKMHDRERRVLAGSIIGTIFGCFMIAVTFFVFQRRRRNRRKLKSEEQCLNDDYEIKNYGTVKNDTQC